MYSSVDEFYQNKQSLKGGIKLHLGCGSNYLDGWCNIDAYPSEDSDTHRGICEVAPDIWADIANIPASSNSIDAILTHHVMEHFYRHQTIRIYQQFMDLLKPGGVIITEMPDLSRILFLLRFLPVRPRYPREMKADRDIILAQLYGASWEANDQGYPYHKYLWKRDEFCSQLRQLGYNVILATGATRSHLPFRDMAVLCQKPIGNNTSVILNPITIEILNGYGSLLSRFIKQLKTLSKLALHY